eukprot:scaffold5298_cov131-Isochrysis_galbana.AAC.6
MNKLTHARISLNSYACVSEPACVGDGVHGEGLSEGGDGTQRRGRSTSWPGSTAGSVWRRRGEAGREARLAF